VAKPVLNISVWAIALGLLIMILAVSTGNGLRKAIQNKVTGFGGDIQILNYRPNPTYEQVPLALSDSLLQALNADPRINYIQAFGQRAGILKKDDLFEGVVLKGLSADYKLDFFQEFLIEGKIPSFSREGYQDSVLISDKLARKLKLELNQKVEMFFVRNNQAPLRRRFIIAGLFRTDFEELDETFILGDLKHVRRLAKWEDFEVGAYEVHLKENEDPENVASDIRYLLPFEYDALSARRLNLQLFQWLDLFDLNILIIIVIIILVATINMSIALLILIMERTSMIGLLKALGAKDFSIQKIFLLNATYLIGKGLLWGNLLGFGLTFLQKQFGFIKLDPETYYVSVVSIDLSPLPILGLNIITLFIALVCLLIPSYLVSRVSPNKAIRFD